jgi:hypothetical protein
MCFRTLGGIDPKRSAGRVAADETVSEQII